jgi:UDP-3-O-[3-hydroxymyristoyl] glucosamine N-acyltransferase
LGHLSSADGVNISAGSLVSRSIAEPGTYTGVFPLMPNREWRHNAVLLKHLDALTERIKSLETEIANMKAER